MKRIKITLIALLPLLFFSISSGFAQKSGVSPEVAAVGVRHYIQSEFPNNTLIYIKRQGRKDKLQFNALLYRSIHLNFDKNGQIMSVSSEYGIPSSVLPPSISQYIAQKYPYHKIVSWAIKGKLWSGKYTQEVTLADGIIAVFNIKDAFIGNR